MMLASTKISLVLASAFLLTAVGAVALVSYLLYQDQTDLDAQVVVIAESSALQRQYTEIVNLMNDTAAEREQIEQYILQEDNIISFLSEIETTGRSLGLMVKTTDLSTESVETEEFNTLKVALTFSGSEQAVLTYLQLLENLPYAVHIPTFSFTGDVNDRSQVSGQLQINLAMQPYE